VYRFTLLTFVHPPYALSCWIKRIKMKLYLLKAVLCLTDFRYIGAFVRLWCRGVIRYSVPWPLGVLIDEYSMATYEAAHAKLLAHHLCLAMLRKTFQVND